MKYLTSVLLAIGAATATFGAADVTTVSPIFTDAQICPILPGTHGLAKWIIVRSDVEQTDMFVLVGRAIQPADSAEMGPAEYSKLEIGATGMREVEQRLRALDFQALPYTGVPAEITVTNRSLRTYLDGRWQTVTFNDSWTQARKSAFDAVWDWMVVAEAASISR